MSCHPIQSISQSIERSIDQSIFQAVSFKKLIRNSFDLLLSMIFNVSAVIVSFPSLGGLGTGRRAGTGRLAGNWADGEVGESVGRTAPTLVGLVD